MIYILSGTDTQKRSAHLKNLTENRDSIRLQSDISTEKLRDYASMTNLFGSSPTLILENTLTQVPLAVKDMNLLKESKTHFIFLEDTLKAVTEKKFKLYADIKHFDLKKIYAQPKANTFALVDAFARRDKIGAWILYSEQLENGIQPEAISGLLFWKIKTMIQNGNKLFSLDELKQYSSNLVSLYHEAHRGERDFGIGLEQFILTSLTPQSK